MHGQGYDAKLRVTGHKKSNSSGIVNTPVAEVITVLKDMQIKLQNDMAIDEAASQNYSCWCDDQKAIKNKEISASTSKVEELKASIESLSGKSGSLASDTEVTEKKLSDDKAALLSGTSASEKELKAYETEAGELTQALANLKNALAVLENHSAQGEAFPQLPMVLMQVHDDGSDDDDDDAPIMPSRSLDLFMDRNGYTLDSATPTSDRDITSQRFLQHRVQAHTASSPASTAPPTTASLEEHAWSDFEVAEIQSAIASASALLQSDENKKSQASLSPQSSEILGILKQLHEQMDEKLKSTLKDIDKAKETFSALRESKNSEIQHGQSHLKSLKSQSAQASIDLTEAKKDLSQEASLLAQARQAITSLKHTCQESSVEFEQSKKSRQEEIMAVSEALALLAANGTASAITRTWFETPQASAPAPAVAGVVPAVFLQEAAQSAKNAFGSIKRQITSLISLLNEQQDKEVEKNKWCLDKYQENNLTEISLTERLADIQASKLELDSKLEKLQSEINATKDEIKDSVLGVKQAAAIRKQEKLTCEQAIKDQAITLAVLKEVLSKLAYVYDKPQLVQTKQQGRLTHQNLMQMQNSATPTPPSYEKNAKGRALIDVLQQIVSEVKNMQRVTAYKEDRARAQYNTFLHENYKEVGLLQKVMTNKASEKARAATQNEIQVSNMGSVEKELTEVTTFEGALHTECDFLVANFRARQEARANEIEGLQQAGRVIRGSDLGA